MKTDTEPAEARGQPAHGVRDVPAVGDNGEGPGASGQRNDGRTELGAVGAGPLVDRAVAVPGAPWAEVDAPGAVTPGGTGIGRAPVGPHLLCWPVRELVQFPNRDSGGEAGRGPHHGSGRALPQEVFNGFLRGWAPWAAAATTGAEVGSSSGRENIAHHVTKEDDAEGL